MGAPKFRVAEREVSMDVPIGYAPRSTLLPPPPSDLPTFSAPAPLLPFVDAPFVDALGCSFTMEMDWTDRANDEPWESGPQLVAAPWDEDRPTMPSAAW